MPDEEKAAGEASLADLNVILGLASGLSDAPEDSPAERRDRAAADDADLDVRLKKVLAISALCLLIVQILFADFIFYEYAANNNWHIPTAAISAWLGATVIEVIGIVTIMASYLFPKRTAKRKR